MNGEKDIIRFDLPGGFHVGTRYQFNLEQIEQLKVIIDARADRSDQILNGRGNVVHTEITGIGKVVIKRFMRGGLLRFVVRRKYLRSGQTRAEGEFRLLEKVRELHVNAP